MQWIAIAQVPMNDMLAWAVKEGAGDQVATSYDRVAHTMRISVPVTAQTAAWAGISAELTIRAIGAPDVEELRVLSADQFRREMLSAPAHPAATLLP